MNLLRSRLGKLILGISIWMLAAFPALPACSVTWLEWSAALADDDNVYSFVIPQHDSFWLLNFKANFNEKLQRTTHFGLNYDLSYASYNREQKKDYVKNGIYGKLEEDLASSLVAALPVSLVAQQYLSSYSTYNYILFDTTPALRFFIFAFDFTSIDWGLQYSLYNLPNYNFSKEGWTPSLNFREEVVEYHGVGTFLTIKQALPYTLDLEITGKLMNKFCPERPLYAQPSTTTQNFFSDDLRQDLETTLLFGLSRRFPGNSSLSLSYCLTQVQSNANAQINDPVTGVRLEDGYYNMNKSRMILDGMYVYGQENSYVRLYATYTPLQYGTRRAQNQDGTFSPESRLDQEYSALLEFNQRLGSWAGLSWLLKLGFQHTQTVSNDYYYQYSKEVITLGLSSFLYL